MNYDCKWPRHGLPNRFNGIVCSKVCDQWNEVLIMLLTQRCQRAV